MTWKPLEERLTFLPLVLAGPILRQVTTDSVTVWVALRRKADVTLSDGSRHEGPLGRKSLLL